MQFWSMLHSFYWSLDLIKVSFRIFSVHMKVHQDRNLFMSSIKSRPKICDRTLKLLGLLFHYLCFYQCDASLHTVSHRFHPFTERPSGLGVIHWLWTTITLVNPAGGWVPRGPLLHLFPSFPGVSLTVWPNKIILCNGYSTIWYIE